MAVTTNGRIHIAGRMPEGTTINPMVYIALGTGTPTSTALGAEVSRIFFTLSRTDNVITYTGHWSTDDDLEGDITEAGIFNVDNVMLCSATFAILSKAINDDLIVTWVLTI